MANPGQNFAPFLLAKKFRLHAPQNAPQFFLAPQDEIPRRGAPPGPQNHQNSPELTRTHQNSPEHPRTPQMAPKCAPAVRLRRPPAAALKYMAGGFNGCFTAGNFRLGRRGAHDRARRHDENAIRLHPLGHILRPNLKLQVISTVTVHSGNNLASALRTGSGGGLGDPGVPAKGWVAMILPFPGRSGVP